MEPSLGWTLLSRDALRRAEKQVNNDVQGVRDEIGFLALHQLYSNRFFPGTSVLHTRLRYVLFVPWIYMGLIEDGVRERVADAVNDAEIKLVGQLRLTSESGIIGKENFPKPTTQPPCLVYWSVLGSWRVLRPLKDGSYPPRSVVHRTIGQRTAAGRLQDDDKQLMQENEPLFASLPSPPKAWGKQHEKLDFRLRNSERRFLRNQIIGLSRPESSSPSLLSRLVEANISMSPKTDMWSDEILDVADDADRAALKRAQQAASLSAIGRGIYAALVEEMRDDYDKVESGTKHRDAVEHLIDEYGQNALKLNIADVPNDAVKIDDTILQVLNQTQAWLRDGKRDLSQLYEIYCKAESKRKGNRARLPKNLSARTKRLEWLPEEHPQAQPLHYRWAVARGFVTDLIGDTGSGKNGEASDEQ